MNIRKINKSVSIMCLLIWFMSGSFLSAEAQHSFHEEIMKHRTDYKSAFISEANSPLKEGDLKNLDFYEPDKAYKVSCQFKSAKKGLPFEIPTSSGKTKVYTRFGFLKFKINGKKQKLTVYRSPVLAQNPLYKDYLFIPFKDETSGHSTYGGGRYLDLRMGEIDGKTIIIDFNKAYNPYCAYSLGYSCPIPPEENYLKTGIEAGEKNYKGSSY